MLSKERKQRRQANLVPALMDVQHGIARAAEGRIDAPHLRHRLASHRANCDHSALPIPRGSFAVIRSSFGRVTASFPSM